MCLKCAALMADSAKLHIEAVKPDKPRVMGLLIFHAGDPRGPYEVQGRSLDFSLSKGAIAPALL